MISVTPRRREAMGEKAKVYFTAPLNRSRSFIGSSIAQQRDLQYDLKARNIRSVRGGGVLHLN